MKLVTNSPDPVVMSLILFILDRDCNQVIQRGGLGVTDQNLIPSPGHKCVSFILSDMILFSKIIFNSQYWIHFTTIIFKYDSMFFTYGQFFKKVHTDFLKDGL